MKRLHLKEIHNTLSISKNKLGISLDSLYKSHPYQISFDIFSDLISKDKYIEIDKNKKEMIIIMIPNNIKENVRDLLVDGYMELSRGDNTIFYLFDIPDISRRTGLDFSNKIKQ